jgi:hypothetical protein
MQKVTLIGEKQARVGFKFLFEGSTELCEKCEVKKVCLGNLEPKRLYEVKKIFKKRFPCILHYEDAVVVEVEEPPIEAAVQARVAFNDALITYDQLDCMNRVCVNWRKCFPVGLVKGDKCKVVKAGEPLQCPLKVQLLSVSLQRKSEASGKSQ